MNEPFNFVCQIIFSSLNLNGFYVFRYIIPLFWKTYKRETLEENDLYEVINTQRARYLGEKLERHLIRDISKYGNLSIYRILWSCYGNEYLYLGIVQLFMRTVVV